MLLFLFSFTSNRVLLCFAVVVFMCMCLGWIGLPAGQLCN